MHLILAHRRVTESRRLKITSRDPTKFVETLGDVEESAAIARLRWTDLHIQTRTRTEMDAIVVPTELEVLGTDEPEVVHQIVIEEEEDSIVILKDLDCSRANFGASKPVDPYTIDEVVSFAYFSNWYQTLNPTIDEPDTLRARYDDYLLDILSRTSRAFIEEQSQYAYFLERYMPKDTPKSMKQEAYDIFMSELSAGEMDHFTIDAPEGEIGLGMDERIQDSSLMAGEPSSKVVLIKSIPPKLPRTALETVSLLYCKPSLLTGQSSSQVRLQPNTSLSQLQTRGYFDWVGSCYRTGQILSRSSRH